MGKRLFVLAPLRNSLEPDQSPKTKSCVPFFPADRHAMHCVLRNVIKILACIYRKGLEPALVNTPFTHEVAVFLPACYVRHRQSPHESPQVTVGLWPEHEVPLIGHNAVVADPHRRLIQCLVKYVFKCLVVRSLIKQPLAADATLHHMEDHVPGGYSTRSRHDHQSLNEELYGPVPICSPGKCRPIILSEVCREAQSHR